MNKKIQIEKIKNMAGVSVVKEEKTVVFEMKMMDFVTQEWQKVLFEVPNIESFSPTSIKSLSPIFSSEAVRLAVLTRLDTTEKKESEEQAAWLSLLEESYAEFKKIEQDDWIFLDTTIKLIKNKNVK